MQVKLKLFDSLEVLKFDNHQAEYPIHYHDLFCFSIIEKGVFSENELIATEGSIVISHPNEIHQNKLVENIGTSFTTFYISPDVVNKISPFKRTSFHSKLIKNSILSAQLIKLTHMIEKMKHHKSFENNFYDSFSQMTLQLTSLYGHNASFIQKENSTLLEEVKQYIGSNLNSKINLSKLALIVGMSKFQFTRWFKKRVGMTPFEYILLKRVGLGKKLIQNGVPLVDASLDSGFYDQSHFSNYFKRYIGLSPKAYKQSCNIFQDF